MNVITSILLGVIQGLTEFLPVSSSGHLVIIQSFIPGFSQPGVLFDVILHFGTLFSILFFFRGKLLSYINIKFIVLLVLGTIPAVVVGFLFKDKIESLFRSVKLVGFALLVTAFANFYIDKLKTTTKKITAGNAFVTGLFQALAIVPGVSRSGLTIFASVFQKINKKKSAEFSFILSLPAVLGANMLEIMSNPSSLSGNAVSFLAGFIASFMAGVVAIRIVFEVIQNRRFEYFAYYCFIIGVLAIVLS
jgi:undecaprenyl-diphosphatase